MSDILEGLNESQKEAVLYFSSPLLVLAGAGSGKTRVITHKIMFLNKELGIPVNRILAITFTNKAAKEMKERVVNALNLEEEPQWITTFHSLSAKILRYEAENIGYGKDFVIYDEEDSKKLIKDIVEESNLDKDLYKPDRVKNIISQIKQNLDESVLDFYAMQLPHIKAIYQKYQEGLIFSNAMDFDDLLLNVVKLFTENEDIKQKWQNKFDYILVDEYQDTNKIQHQILKLLVGNRDCITVVGDPQQCIYTWRGAHPENILSFEEDFPNTKIIKLERNYRSTQKILEAANKVISHSKGRWKEKVLKLWTDKNKGEDLKLVKLESDKQEAAFIAYQIKELIKQGYKYSDIAVLMRMSFLSRNIEEAFVRMSIPYQIIAGLKFYERAEIKDILAYLRFAFNPKDTQAFKRIINLPSRGIGKSTLNKIQKSYVEDWYQALKDSYETLSKKVKYNLQTFFEVIDFIKKYGNEKPAETAKYLYDSIDYEEYLISKYPKDYEDRIANVQELFTAFEEIEKRGKTLQEFLEETSLEQAQDNIEDSNSVKVMTVHASKGLEYPVVFIAGVEDGIFPSGRAFEDVEQMEEERRLFYVAITRAKEHVYLTLAKYRSSFGNSFNETKPSRFIKDIKEYLKVLSSKPKKKTDNSLSATSTNTGIRVGSLVKHEVFGKGVVKELKPPKAKVIFEKVGEKELLTKFLKAI
ncbi:ATP-dependent helicase [Hydrogenothermus marinus]|uniref:DNA 3'-5' helicase n=1 Tax=Hydrogenothermus marinus TaxID=133270 RepID=A0A3M0BMX6_9AQUI|nr:UvrD-helicase domain-containing protein [Hydrogenothermus marinus]RMA97824.1 DNA helicase-2/ATP-dependent DNA helicase PcrA [Hydrogenothermus marinus]